MDLITLIFVTGTATLAGGVFGYFLRWVITLGRKGSIELTLKQAVIDARDQAQKITDKAQQEAEALLSEIKTKERDKEAELKKKEDRLLKKDELLDQRQTDIDKESELLKTKIVTVAHKEEQLRHIEERQLAALERVAQLRTDEAKQELLATIEKNYAEDLLTRMRKLEVSNNEELELKARSILSTVIQRWRQLVSRRLPRRPLRSHRRM